MKLFIFGSVFDSFFFLCVSSSPLFCFVFSSVCLLAHTEYSSYSHYEKFVGVSLYVFFSINLIVLCQYPEDIKKN